MSASIMGYLEAGEDLGKPEIFGEDQNNPDFSIFPIWKYGRGRDDCVFIDVRTDTYPVVLLGGNALHIQAVRGLGRLTTINLESGKRETTVLKPLVTAEVKAPSVHWYESDEDLLVRDNCEAFDPQLEVPLTDVVEAVINTFRGSFR